MKLIIVTHNSSLPPTFKQTLQNQLRNLQSMTADRSVDGDTPSLESRGELNTASSSVSGHGFHEEIQDGKA